MRKQLATGMLIYSTFNAWRLALVKMCYSNKSGMEVYGMFLWLIKGLLASWMGQRGLSVPLTSLMTDSLTNSPVSHLVCAFAPPQKLLPAPVLFRPLPCGTPWRRALPLLCPCTVPATITPLRPLSRSRAPPQIDPLPGGLSSWRHTDHRGIVCNSLHFFLLDTW